MINESIFRSYDIRGIYPSEINEEAVEKIGRAVVAYLKPKQVVVGRDMRLSSPSLHRALLKGITEAGANVIDIGMVPTPVTYFTVAKYGYDAGIMISASHNPPEYNGLKIVKKKSIQLSKDTGISDIAKIVLSSDFPKAKKTGRIINKDVREAYYQHILRATDYCSRSTRRELETQNSSHQSKADSNNKNRRLNIIVDAGNGMGGAFNKPVLDKLPIKYKAMYFKPDGSYPNHPANPAEDKNLVDLIKAIKKQKADLGIAFDGDADRAIFIDDKGEKLNSDYYVALIAPEILRNSADKRVYYDLRFSKVAVDALKKIGAKPVRTRVGNPFYKIGLIEKGGAMAAEQSGHIMFHDGFGLDDGLLATVKLMSFLSRQQKSLSKLRQPLEGYYSNSGEINIESHNSAKVVAGLEKKYGKIGKVDKLDGLTVVMKDWWFNVRGSNTEPMIRVCLETKPDAEFMKLKRDELLSDIKELDV